MSQPLLIRDEGNRQSKDGLLLVTGLHQKSLESGLTEVSSADRARGRREMWSAPERVQRENSFEKVGQDPLKTRK